MRKSFLAILLLVNLSSCLQAENSNSQDKATYGDVGGTAEFLAVRTILTNYCAGCHNYHTISEADMKTQGLIVAGNPDNSKMYCRLIGAATSCGAGFNKNMPSGSGGLSSSDLNMVRFWIVNVTP